MKLQENLELREEDPSIMNADEARQNGKMLRKTCKRSSHADWKYARDRDHIIDLLKEQEQTRIQELLPVRHERMSASPFAFYRGAAIMKCFAAGTVHDSKVLPAVKETLIHSK